MKLSVLIPVYNEKSTILELLKKVDSVIIKGVEKEVVIVDDCSSDGTREILSSLNGKQKIIFHEHNMGKGAAVRSAIKHSTGDILVIQDADLEYNPDDYACLIKPLLENESDVVYGSRFLVQDKEKLKHLRSHYIGNRLLTFITNVFFGCKLTDMETCYKMFRKNVLDGINLKARGFEFEPEITAKICKKGFKIKEVPINYNYRTFDEGKKITKIDGLKAIYYLLRYRFAD